MYHTFIIPSPVDGQLAGSIPCVCNESSREHGCTGVSGKTFGCLPGMVELGHMEVLILILGETTHCLP